MKHSRFSSLSRALGVIVAASLLMTGFMATAAPATTASAEMLAFQGIADGAIQGDTFTSAPVPDVQAESASEELVQPTADQTAASQAMQARSDAAWAARTENTNDGSDHAVAGPSGGETIIPVEPDLNAAAKDAGGPQALSQPDPQAAGDATMFLDYFTLAPTTGSSVINEPSHAQIGKYIMYAGNWYAAESTNGGGTWGYYDPYATMPDFCCDQDVVHDAGRNLFIWLRLGNFDDAPGPSLQNRMYIRTSHTSDLFSCGYFIQPSDLNVTYTNQFFDYPKITTSHRHLYISANMYSGSLTFLRMVLIRYSLDDLEACSATSPTYWTNTAGWSWEPIQGNRDGLWMGDTYSSAGTFRIWAQPFDSSSLFFGDRAIPAWTFTNHDGTCSIPNGSNPCNRADQRITGGYLANGLLGFFWNVKQGGGFTYPYVNHAEFIVGTGWSYYARRFIYSGSQAFQYAAAADNDRKHIGIAVMHAGGGGNPGWYYGIWDDYSAVPPGWEVYTITNSFGWGAGSGDDMGDFLSVRKFLPLGTMWTASGYYGHSDLTYQPEYVVFGRERETSAYNYWFNK